MTDFYKTRPEAVIHVHQDGLSRKVWVFSLPWGSYNHSQRIKLTEYLCQVRETKRHKWVAVVQYPTPAYYHRHSTVIYPERDTIIVPEAVIQTFFNRIVDRGIA